MADGLGRRDGRVARETVQAPTLGVIVYSARLEFAMTSVALTTREKLGTRERHLRRRSARQARDL
jgi:hypothetical protein